jgi:glutathione-regulated potassium-efflux system ancillary protein KefG
MSQKVLLLFAHPSAHRSEVNRPLLDASKLVDGVTIVDLYAEYPCHDINIDREQSRLVEHDAIVFMFPMYWYSTPAILKEWQDLVLEYGFAYGQDGTALQGKKLLCAITAGAAESTYQAEGHNHYSIAELLRPLQQTANLCGIEYLPPYLLFGSRTAIEEGRVEQHVDGWVQVLTALQQGRINRQKLSSDDKLNDSMELIAGKSQ